MRGGAVWGKGGGCVMAVGDRRPCVSLSVFLYYPIALGLLCHEIFVKVMKISNINHRRKTVPVFDAI